MCKAAVAERIKVDSDIQLVVNQVLGEYVARDLATVKYLDKVKELLAGLSYFKI